MKLQLSILCILALGACAQRTIDTTQFGNTGVAGPVATANTQTPVLDENGFPVFDPVTGLPVYENAQVGVQIDSETQLTHGEIAENPNEIVLSSYSQEQQKIDRERYAQQINQIAANRQQVTGVIVPEASTVSAAAFARSTTHAVGTKVYDRGRNRGSCRSYATSVDAQRAFLEAGGPFSDPLGIDPDGDGFACKFDPTPYRVIQY